MIATKFEPSENWLPPGFCISQDRAFPIAKWAAEMARKEAEKARAKSKDEIAKKAAAAAEAQTQEGSEGQAGEEDSSLREGKPDDDPGAVGSTQSGADGGADSKQKTSDVPKSPTKENQKTEEEAPETTSTNEATNTTTTTSTSTTTNTTMTVSTRVDQPSLDLSKLHATLYKDTEIESLPYILQVNLGMRNGAIRNIILSITDDQDGYLSSTFYSSI